MNPDDIVSFFRSAHSVLKEGGAFLIQILNYDHILDHGIRNLPHIENDEIRFSRRYEPGPSGLLDFTTELFIRKTGQSIHNSIPLNPVRRGVLENFLKESGFSGIEFFGSFTKTELKADSLPLVIQAVK